MFAHRGRAASNRFWWFILSLVMFAAALLLAFQPRASVAATTHEQSTAHPPIIPAVAMHNSPSSSRITAENALPGTDEWASIGNYDINSLQAYAGATSVNAGGSVNIHVKSTGSSLSARLYRIGYYQDHGARLYATYSGIPTPAQPNCTRDSSTGLVSCPWSPTFSVSIDPSWISGFYLLRLDSNNGYRFFVYFIVRNDGYNSDILVMEPTKTNQAYNRYGGESLYYSGNNDGRVRAYKVSFDRPYLGGAGTGSLFSHDIEMVRWLEASGYDVSYISDTDRAATPGLLLNHRVFLVEGHDEYWSWGERDAMEAARDAGVSIIFASANESYWRIRLENSPTGVNRIITCYKESDLDPSPDKTITFRDLGRPENSLVGTGYQSYFDETLYNYPWVALALAGSWYFDCTGFQPGDRVNNIVGEEWDAQLDNGFTPPGIEVMARGNMSNPRGEPLLHESTIYTSTGGAHIFAAGSLFFSWGLIDHSYPNQVFQPAYQSNAADPRIEQMMANIIDRFAGYWDGQPRPCSGQTFYKIAPRPTRTPMPQVPTATGTPPTATRTFTPTPARSATATPTRQVSATISATPTRTGTPTATITLTNTPTGTATSTLSRTATNTPTITHTRTNTPTSTRTVTNTFTTMPTSTAIPTGTATSAATNTALVPTSTPTSTALIPTQTPTRLPTSTTVMPTATFTTTSTNTAVAPTNTRASTPSNTPTYTASMTPSNTPPNSPTTTPSNIPGNTATDTPTRAPTNAPTNTPTNTLVIPTHTPTFTATPTNSSTTEATSTGTATYTATATPTATQAATSTATRTATTSGTATRTPTPGPSGTPTPVCSMTYASLDVPKAIPDQGLTSSTLNVSDVGMIADIRVVNVTLEHTYASDLSVYLISPQGTRVTLFTNVCGSNIWTAANTGFTIARNGTRVLGTTCPPGRGTYLPEEGSLSPLLGQPSNGIWTLQVVDGGPYDVGTLRAWGLTIGYGGPTCPIPGYWQGTATAAVPTATATPGPSNASFADVPSNTTFYPYITWMAALGYVRGYDCGGVGEPCPGAYFRPGANVTRGQLLKMAVNAAGWGLLNPKDSTFADVPRDNPFYNFVETAYSSGIVQGYACGAQSEPCDPSNKPYFRPGSNVTRGQLSKIIALARGYALPGPTLPTFTDVPSSGTFFGYVEAIYAHAIVSGYPCGGPGEPCDSYNRPYFRPANSATRGQVSKIVAIGFGGP